MDIVIMVIVAITCMSAAMSIFNAKERNTIFNKKPIEVTDVSAYNKRCGFLVLGFGAVAEITLVICFLFGSVTVALMPILLVVEAIFVIKIYEKIESKYIKKK